jgi:rhodanese-related sulfurtransferase
LIGLPRAPAIVDVRTPDEIRVDPSVIPSARLFDPDAISSWAGQYADRAVVVYCQRGQKHSEGAAAWMRGAGVDAQVLEGGFEEWRRAGEPRLDASKVPPRDASGRAVWVTRARPKIVRIACPWLIRRFIDPAARFLYVPPSGVKATAERFGATPFDVDGLQWSDRGERCTFDVMLAELGLATSALSRLALIVRGADTGRLDLAPQSAGLLAASLGLSRMYRDDLAQLDAAMALYDAFYRWCRDAVDETHG